MEPRKKIKKSVTEKSYFQIVLRKNSDIYFTSIYYGYYIHYMYIYIYIYI